ncbi:MAG: hypothetical protein RL018_997 [Pseudomonadota bacterium]|jgi:hypothetical protein
MLSLLSTLGGLLISGLPQLLKFFQDKGDKAHELQLARLQNERELQMIREGHIAQAKMEEIRTDQVAMQTEAAIKQAAYEHDGKVLAKASSWVASYVATVRPTVTYLFVLELVAINVWMCVYLFNQPNLVESLDDVLKYGNMIFSEDEMAMLSGIIGFWFGTQQWEKK